MASVPTRPKGKKRPSDVISSAVKVIRIASGEESEDFGTETGKNQAAAELGRMGGTKHAEDMTPERPAYIAKWWQHYADTEDFLRNHLEEIASIDLVIVPTSAFRQLFIFLVLGHRRRQLLWFVVAQNPTAECLARQINEAFSWDTAPKYLIRLTSFRSPWQSGYVERLIGSVRRECTDHLIAFNAEHRSKNPCEIRHLLCFAREGRALQTPDRAARKRYCASGSWRAASSVRSNLGFGSDGYALALFLANDRVKLLAYRIFDPAKAGHHPI
jgi:hypothetical protein